MILNDTQILFKMRIGLKPDWFLNFFNMDSNDDT